MAEAVAVIGLVASIGSLIDLSLKIIARVSDFSKDTSDVPESFRSVADRLPLLNQTLQSIRKRADCGHIQESVAKDLKKLIDGILDQCAFLQVCFDSTVPTLDASRFKKALKGLHSLTKDEKVKQAIEKIHKGIDVLVLHQTTSSVDIGDRILDELNRLNVQESPSRRNFGLCLGQAPLIEPKAFIGRDVEVQQLQEWLSPEVDPHLQKVVSIVGMGGLGKTQLSLAFARQYLHRYTSVFWINAKDELTLRQSISALSGIIFAEDIILDGNAEKERAQIEKVRRWLSEDWNSRWVLIYDNYDDPNLTNIRSSTGFDIRSFFPHRAQGSILITTRSPKLSFCRQMKLHKLEDVSQAVAVLSQRADEDFSTDSDAQNLAIRLDGLPLALATAGSYLGQSSMSCKEYLQAYESMWIDLCGPESEELFEYENRTLSTTWIMSLEQVRKQDADAAELFQFLAYFSREDIWYELIQTNADERPPWMDRVTRSKIQFERSMMRLQNYSLIDSNNGSYSVHPCIHDWLTEYFGTTQDNFIAALKCTSKIIPDYFHPEYTTITRRILVHLDRLDDERFQEYWEASIHNRDILDICNILVTLYASNLEPDKEENHCKRRLKGTMLAYGNCHGRCLRPAIELVKRYHSNGKADLAKSVFERMFGTDVAALETNFDDGSLAASWLFHDIGHYFIWVNNLAGAKRVLERAYEGRKKMFGPDNVFTLAVLRSISDVEDQEGQHDRAEEIQKQVLAAEERTRGVNDMINLTTVVSLGRLYMKHGKWNRAEQMFHRALAAYQPLYGCDHVLTKAVLHAQKDLKERKASSKSTIAKASETSASKMDAATTSEGS